MRWMRRLYEWVLHWADTRYGLPALVALAFAESSFFPVPPDVLLIPLCLGKRNKALMFALVCTVSSVIGGLFGYLIGWGFYETIGIRIVEFYHAQELFQKLCTKFNEYSFWAVFVPALTPIPYKIFTISSGVTKIAIPIFLVASVAGRGLRFFAVAGLLRAFGEPIRSLIDRYFNLVMILFMILLIGGVVVIKFAL